MPELQEAFEGIDQTSYEKILSQLLTEGNIDLKSDLKNPMALTQLASLSKWCEKEKLTKTQEMIDSFIEKYLRYMVSHNRKSRTEIVQAFNDIYKDNLSRKDKLLGKGNDSL